MGNDGGIVLPITVQDDASGKLEKIAKNGERAKKSLEMSDVADGVAKAEKVFNNLGIKVPKVFSAVKDIQNAIKSGDAANVISQTARSIMDASDQATKLQGKLALALDQGSSVNAFKAKIKEAADEARIDFDTMADSIAGIGMVVNDSFSDDELIKFTKSLGTLYNLGGVDAAQIKGSMTQIKQALSSGKLQGDEFASLRDLPGFLQILADEMDVPVGKVKELASEGKITADVLKNALINAGDDLQGKLNEIPETFDSRINRVNNSISLLTNKFGLMVNKIANCGPVVFIFEVLEKTFDNLKTALDVIMAGFDALAKAIEPIIKPVEDFLDSIGAMEKAVKAFSNVLTAIIIGLVGYLVILGLQWIWAGVQALIAGVQMFIAALMAGSPLAWIILLIVLIVGGLSLLCDNFAQAFGIIGGVVGVAVAGIWNLFLALLDFLLGIVNILLDRFAMFANFFGNLFNDPVASIIHLIADMANAILGIVKTVASALDKVFGTKLAKGVQGWMDNVDEWADKAADKWGNGSYEKKAEFEDLTSESLGLHRMEYGKSWNQGYNIGSNLGAGLDNLLAGLNSGAGDSTDLSGLGSQTDLSDYDASSGKGSLSTSLDDDSVDELKAMAEIQYRLNYKHITPNVNIKFGDVRETADLDDVTKYLKKMMDKDLEELYITEEG